MVVFQSLQGLLKIHPSLQIHNYQQNGGQIKFYYFLNAF